MRTDFQALAYMKEAKYTVELTSAYAEWWRYNVYLSVVGFDAAGEMAGYVNAVDRICEIEDGAGAESRQAPADYPAGRATVAESVPCDHIAVYVYVIANTFPRSVLIRDSPPFPAELTVRRVSESGKPEEVFRRTYEVNQWGGLTVSGLRLPPEEGPDR